MTAPTETIDQTIANLGARVDKACAEIDRLRNENADLRLALVMFPGRSCSELEWSRWILLKEAALKGDHE